MNLAEPAPTVEPATAAMAVATDSVDQDGEYKVEPAPKVSDRLEVETYKVGPAVTISDPRKFAPNKQLQEPHRNPDLDIPVERLRKGLTGVVFESRAGVCKGIHMTCTRKCLPFLYDERDFTSLGEILRYIVIKDGFCFVYGEKSDPNPLYNVPIDSLKAVKEDPNKPHKTSLTVSPMANTNAQGEGLETVLLLDSRNVLAYQFTFDVSEEEDLADRFVTAVENEGVKYKSKGKEAEAEKEVAYV